MLQWFNSVKFNNELQLFNSVLQRIMPPPSSTGEVYCFPRRKQIFSFGRRVIYRLKGLWEYIPKSIPSVCLSIYTTIFKRIAGLRFYPKSLMLYINGFASTGSTKYWKAFFNFSKIQIRFRFIGQKQKKIFKQI